MKAKTTADMDRLNLNLEAQIGYARWAICPACGGRAIKQGEAIDLEKLAHAWMTHDWDCPLKASK
jgi:hypothetical protein